MATVLARRVARNLVSLGLLSLSLALPSGNSAQAATRSGFYVAALASPLESARQEIMDGVMWKCAGERCSAPAEGSRPLLACGRVAKKFGPVAHFTSPQGELSMEDLARCNAMA